MRSAPVSFVVFLILVILFSFIWGRMILFNARKKYLMTISMYLMRFVRIRKQYIHSVLVGFLYTFTGVLGIALFCILFRFNVFEMFKLQYRYMVFIILGFLSQMGVSSLIMTYLITFTPNIDWVSEIRSIPWIESISLMPEKLGPFIPLIGAFFEELFFRGVLFIIMVRYYPEVGIIIPIIVSSVLFAVQQILNTETLAQGITMGIASVVISAIGCLLILYTGSFLPALIAHEAFVVFYFKQMGFSYEEGTFDRAL